MTVGRSTQSVVEVLLAPTPVAIVTQAVVEVLLAPTPAAIVTQAVVEVLVTVAEASPEPENTQPVIFICSG